MHKTTFWLKTSQTPKLISCRVVLNRTAFPTPRHYQTWPNCSHRGPLFGTIYPSSFVNLIFHIQISHHLPHLFLLTSRHLIFSIFANPIIQYTFTVSFKTQKSLAAAQILSTIDMFLYSVPTALTWRAFRVRTAVFICSLFIVNFLFWPRS